MKMMNDRRNCVLFSMLISEPCHLGSILYTVVTSRMSAPLKTQQGGKKAGKKLAREDAVKLESPPPERLLARDKGKAKQQ